MPVTIERLSPETVAQISAVRERRLRRGSLRDRGKRIEIGLVNNMPDAALLATERQFSNLLTAASGRADVRLHLFALRDVPRSAEARAALKRTYRDASELGRRRLDALIVTGAEPLAPELAQEPYWAALTELRRLGRFQYGLDDSFVSGGACRRAASRRNRAPALAGQMLGNIRFRDGAAQQTRFGPGRGGAGAAFAPQRIERAGTDSPGLSAALVQRRNRRRRLRQAAAKPCSSSCRAIPNTKTIRWRANIAAT